MTSTIPIRRRSTQRPDLSLRAVALAAISGLALAVGCDRDEGSQSVREASAGLHTVTGGATTVTPAGVREKKYAGVVNSAKAGIDGGATSANAALIMTAQAQLGQADEPMGRFAASEREFANRTTVIRSRLAAYIQHSAQAAAARQYDPAKDLAEIDKSIAGKTTEIAEQEKIKSEINAKVADLRAQAKVEMDAAGQLDAQAAQFREQAAKGSAVQGEGLIRQSAEKRRAADARRMKGLQFQAQVDVTEPIAREAAMLVEKLTNQKSDFEATAKELHERDRAAKELAAATSAEAAKSAEGLAKDLDELAKLRSGPLASAADDALSKLNSAKGSAQKASSAGGPAKLLLGDINQTIAELAWQRSFGQGGYAQLLEAVAATQPPVSEKAKYEADAKTAREEEKKSLEAAKEAFDAAKSAYQGAGGKGEAKDRLERLGELLEKSGLRAGGEKLDLLGAFAAKAKKADDSSEPAPAPAAGGESSDLNGTIETILGLIAGDQYEQVFDYINASTPEQQQMISALKASMPGLMRLDAACKSKFGQSFLAAGQQAAAGMGLGGGGGGAAGFSSLKGLTLADLKVQENGDTATAEVPGDPAPMQFTKVNGKWLIDLPAPPAAAQGPAAGIAMRMLELTGPIFSELATEVENGNLQSMQAVQMALIQKVQAKPEIIQLQQQMMQQLQNQGGGGPK